MNRVGRLELFWMLALAVGLGCGSPASAAAPAPAETEFVDLMSLAIDSNDSIYFNDRALRRIYKLTRDRKLSVYAGNGSDGTGGDGGNAVDAELGDMNHFALDASGNLYVAQHKYHRVRKIDARGIITTWFGDGTRIHKKDGVKALQTGIDRPNHVAIDITGNLFVSSCCAHFVRKVDPSGTVTTVAGNIAHQQPGKLKDIPCSSPMGVRCDLNGICTSVR